MKDTCDTLVATFGPLLLQLLGMCVRRSLYLKL
jgi:hypothetical protein